MVYTTEMSYTKNLSRIVCDVLLNKYSFSYASRIVIYPELFDRIIERVRPKTLQAFEFGVYKEGTVDEKILLGTLYWTGYTRDFDYNRVFTLFGDAAQRGHSEAYFFLGQMYEVMDRTPDRLDRAFQMYTNSARRTQDRAQLYLGWCYQRGYLCEQSVENATTWYKRVISQYSKNINLLKSVPNDSSLRSALALKLIEKAETIYEQMQNFLQAFNLEFGVEGTQNDEEAFRLYSMAAEADLAEARCALAHMYEAGRGTKASVDTANFWFRNAMKLGYPYAVFALNPQCKDIRLKQDINIDEDMLLDSDSTVRNFTVRKRETQSAGAEKAAVTEGSRVERKDGEREERRESKREERKEERREDGLLSAVSETVNGGKEKTLAGYGDERTAGQEIPQKKGPDAGEDRQKAEAGAETVTEDRTESQETPVSLPTQKFNKQLVEARKGDPYAQFLVGRSYEEGVDVKRDHAKAFEWFQKAADKEYYVACYFLGVKYLFGIGTFASPYSAFLSLTQASEVDYKKAGYLLGYLYANGYGINKNLVMAEKFAIEQDQKDIVLDGLFPAGVCRSKGTGARLEELGTRAREGDTSAQYILFVCHALGLFCPADAKEAMRWLKMAADAGNISAIYQLGYCYEHGWLVDRKLDTAFIYIQKAAKMNHPDAMCDLGNFYFNGEGGVETSHRAANIWYKNAAARNVARAKYYLGMRLLHGEGVMENIRAAFKAFREGASMGDPMSVFWLGRCYYSGWGTIRDLDRAIEKYERGAKLGEYNSIGTLANIYFDEDDEYYDPQSAINLLKQGAEGGDIELQCNLALRYLHGQGVEQNTKDALHWFTRASEQDCLFAMAYVAALTMKDSGFEKHIANFILELIGRLEGVKTYRELQAKAKEGNSLAQTIEGILGYFRTRNEAEAYEHFAEAARNNSVEAQYLVAVMKKEGLGCQKDFSGALSALETMAEKKNEEVKKIFDSVYLSDRISADVIYKCIRSSRQLSVSGENLKNYEYMMRYVGTAENDRLCVVGLLYLTGFMISKNLAKGYQCIQQVCETSSDSLPFYMAGMMSKYGVGTQVDEEAAYSYFERAAKIDLA